MGSVSRVLFELGEDWGLWLPEGIRKAQILRLDVRLPGRPKKPWPKPLKPMVQQLERVEPEALIDGGDCALVQMESGQLALVQSAAFIAPWTEASFPRWRISARPQLLEGDRDPFSALRVFCLPGPCTGGERLCGRAARRRALAGAF